MRVLARSICTYDDTILLDLAVWQAAGRAGREAHRRVAALMLTCVGAGPRRSVSVLCGSSLFVDACSPRYARWYVSTPDGRVCVGGVFILAAPALRRWAAPA